jgi:hypothetical protein
MPNIHKAASLTSTVQYSPGRSLRDCLYLNDSGNGIEWIDSRAMSESASRTGGAWAPGTITKFPNDPRLEECTFCEALVGES